MTVKEARTQIMCVYARNLDTTSEEEQEALNKAMLSLSAWDAVIEAIKAHQKLLRPYETERDGGEDAGCEWCLEVIQECIPGIVCEDDVCD